MPAIQVNKLTGPALDWAVSEAEYQTDPPRKGWVLEYHKTGQKTWPYSTSWEWGGPVIEREGIALEHMPFAKEWEARLYPTDGTPWVLTGPTPLIAGMRCYVASRLGDDVEVPNFADAA